MVGAQDANEQGLKLGVCPLTPTDSFPYGNLQPDTHYQGQQAPRHAKRKDMSPACALPYPVFVLLIDDHDERKQVLLAGTGGVEVRPQVRLQVGRELKELQLLCTAAPLAACLWADVLEVNRLHHFGIEDVLCGIGLWPYARKLHECQPYTMTAPYLRWSCSIYKRSLRCRSTMKHHILFM